MCVILYAEDKKPDLDILIRCENKNGDGAGIAWFKDNKVHYKKGLLAAEVHEFIQTLPLPFVIHFRWESTGGTSLLLNHPFVVSRTSKLHLEGSADKLLFHNGTVKEWEMYLAAAGVDIPKDEPMSDTRAMAIIIAKNNERFLKKVFGNSKFILADATKNRYFYVGHFQFEDGIYYSNMLWKFSNYYSSNNPHTYVSSLSADKSGLLKLSRKQRRKLEKEQQGLVTTFCDGCNRFRDVCTCPEEDTKGFCSKCQRVPNNCICEDGVTRIHENPPNSHFDNNTKKILGTLPLLSSAHLHTDNIDKNGQDFGNHDCGC